MAAMLFHLLLLLSSFLGVITDNFVEYDWEELTSDFNLSNRTLSQPGCQVPWLDLFGDDVMRFYGKEPDFFCHTRADDTSNTTRFALFTEDAQFLYFNASALPSYGSKEVTCSSRNFDRVEGAEDNVRYSTPKPLRTDQPNEILDEFVEVICTDKERGELLYKDYFTFLPLKASTEERCNVRQEWTNDQTINTLIIGLDTVSRLQFYRQFPLSTAFLTDQMRAIVMNGYNKVAENTYPNLVALLSGLSRQQFNTTCLQENEALVDKCPLIWKNFQNRGFRTIFVEDAPDLAIFNFGAKGFQYTPTDYYLRPMYLEYERNAGHDNIGCGYRCLGSRSSLSFLLSHAVKTARVFKDKKYFGFHWSCSATHDTFNIPTQVDETVLEFLKTLHADNLLNNTVLIVMADHGPRIRTAFINTNQGRYEKRMPLLTFVFPDWFKKKYRRAVKNLQRNSHMLTTHFDLHYTLHDFMNLTSLEDANIGQRYRLEGKGSQGRSLFLPISSNRTCSQARIPMEFCACANTTAPVSGFPSVGHAATLLQKAISALKNLIQLAMYLDI